MNNITNKIKVFLADEQGAETVEWVMVAGALALVIAAVYAGTLQGGLNTAMENLTDVVAASSTQ
ncbi:MAG: Flp family type IVb pilin [Methylobacter sp.]